MHIQILIRGSGGLNAIDTASALLADALGELGHDAELTKWTPGRLLNDSAAADLLVLPYNPFMWGDEASRRGSCGTSSTLRRSRRRPELVLVMHELYVPITDARSLAIGSWQRAQLGRAPATGRSTVRLHPNVGEPAQPASFRPDHLPSGSNLPDARAAARSDGRSSGSTTIRRRDAYHRTPVPADVLRRGRLVTPQREGRTDRLPAARRGRLRRPFTVRHACRATGCAARGASCSPRRRLRPLPDAIQRRRLDASRKLHGGAVPRRSPCSARAACTPIRCLRIAGSNLSESATGTPMRSARPSLARDDSVRRARLPVPGVSCSRREFTWDAIASRLPSTSLNADFTAVDSWHGAGRDTRVYLARSHGWLCDMLTNEAANSTTVRPWSRLETRPTSSSTRSLRGRIPRAPDRPPGSDLAIFGARSSSRRATSLFRGRLACTRHFARREPRNGLFGGFYVASNHRGDDMLTDELDAAQVTEPRPPLELRRHILERSRTTRSRRDRRSRTRSCETRSASATRSAGTTIQAIQLDARRIGATPRCSGDRCSSRVLADGDPARSGSSKRCKPVDARSSSPMSGCLRRSSTGAAARFAFAENDVRPPSADPSLPPRTSRRAGSGRATSLGRALLAGPPTGDPDSCSMRPKSALDIQERLALSASAILNRESTPRVPTRANARKDVLAIRGYESPSVTQLRPRRIRHNSSRRFQELVACGHSPRLCQVPTRSTS